MVLKLLKVMVLASSFLLPAVSRTQTLSVGVGKGALNTDAELVSLQFTSHSDLFGQQLNQRGFQAHVEWSLFGMRGKGSNSNDVGVVGVSPVLRYSGAKKSPFLEAGLGAFQFSRRMLNRDDGVGTSFEFGSFLGVGTRVGSGESVEISYRFLHFSNAGISSFNPGLNFHQVRVGYRY